MAAWSMLVRSASQNLIKTRLVRPNFVLYNAVVNSQARNMSGQMAIQASRWQWHKMKDYFHFYFFVGVIPLSIITFCADVFIGPATLTEIPEGYEPKYWEYYRNPITRFLARYVYHSPQKDYEKNLHFIYDESQIIKIRKLEKKIWALQAERQDYKYNYFLPYDNFAAREFREVVRRQRDEME